MDGQNQYAVGDPVTSQPTSDAELRAVQEAIDCGERLAHHGLPLVEPIGHLPPGEHAHFVTPVRFGRRRTDQCGHLELTNTRLRFHGALDVGVAWSEVASIERTGHEILVSLATSRKLLRFSCYAAAEAARGTVIARHLAGSHKSEVTSHKSEDEHEPL